MSGSISVNNLSPKALKFIINVVFVPLLGEGQELDSLKKDELTQLAKSLRDEVRSKAKTEEVVKYFTSWFDLYIIKKGFTSETWRKNQATRFLNNINHAFHYKVTLCKECGYINGEHSEYCKRGK